MWPWHDSFNRMATGQYRDDSHRGTGVKAKGLEPMGPTDPVLEVLGFYARSSVAGPRLNTSRGLARTHGGVAVAPGNALRWSSAQPGRQIVVDHALEFQNVRPEDFYESCAHFRRHRRGPREIVLEKGPLQSLADTQG